ncbi:MAG: MBL fold metallo-hydrolase, partial [Pseudomonadales bacterium]|nr:MBL fold metallo-hydrolase [Pseudomonadales bacterium]
MAVEVWRFGDAAVARIEEMVGPMFDPVSFFPDHDPAVMAAARERFGPAQIADSGRIVASMHSWLIRVEDRTVLVDGCIGNHKDRQPFHRWSGLETDWPKRLAAAGVRPEEIDFVMCTHLHVDHVGWNTQLVDGRWVPTFPNARYLFAREEVEHFRAEQDAAPTEAFDAVSRKVWADSVLPVLDAGLADLVEGVHEVVAGRVCMEPTPGHTPGSASLLLRDDAERALFTGDVIHHPIQVLRPDWNSDFCALPEQARATRRSVLERCADRGALLMP